MAEKLRKKSLVGWIKKEAFNLNKWGNTFIIGGYTSRKTNTVAFPITDDLIQVRITIEELK